MLTICFIVTKVIYLVVNFILWHIWLSLLSKHLFIYFLDFRQISPTIVTIPFLFTTYKDSTTFKSFLKLWYKQKNIGEL